MPSHVILAVNATPLDGPERSRINAALHDAGYDVLVSNSTKDALRLVFVNRRIEAVVINEYGERGIGRELASKMHTIHPSIPILVIEVDPDLQSSRVDPEEYASLAILKLEQLWHAAAGEDQGTQLPPPMRVGTFL